MEGIPSKKVGCAEVGGKSSSSKKPRVGGGGGGRKKQRGGKGGEGKRRMRTADLRESVRLGKGQKRWLQKT